MPLNPDLHKVMIIGSGPIVIGQAAEFDYAGSQACRALKDAGLEVVLVNPNPATIMTDHSSADHIYIEPLTLETLRTHHPQGKAGLACCPRWAGRRGLTLSMQLAKEGFLEQHGVKLLGAKCETIEKAEDRQQFKDTMRSHPPARHSVGSRGRRWRMRSRFAKTIGYPVIVRPAYTLGGSGGGICQDEKELAEIAENGLRLSPITQILVEKCISGWKEIEFEVMRDQARQRDCRLLDGEHRPRRRAYGRLHRRCARADFGGQGVPDAPPRRAGHHHRAGSRGRLQLPVRAQSRYVRLCRHRGQSRASAVPPPLRRRRRATRLPRCAAQIAIGYTLDEMKNAVTGKTCACVRARAGLHRGENPEVAV